MAAMAYASLSPAMKTTTTVTTAVFRRIAASSESPSPPSSYGRRWYNPRRLHLSTLPDSDDGSILRHWVYSDTNFQSLNQEKFTVVSHNILGDRNASKHRDLYRNVPAAYVNWDYRLKLICRDLLGWKPDIICLQEVDRYYDLLRIMEKAGYIGTYKRRTGGSVDGCAMFWKADRFCLVEEESIEFKQFGLRDNVAQICVFEICKAKSRRFVVGNTHVIYNPSRGEVKLGQIRLFSSKADILSKKWGDVPVLLAGDYNSTPQSGIYKFLSTSKLNIMLYNRKELSGQRSCDTTQVLGVKKLKNALFVLMDRFGKLDWTNEEIITATGSTECSIVMHPLKLHSAYAAVKSSRRTRGSQNEPLATSYHSKFLGTVDYLWYSDGLIPTRVLDTVPIEVLKMTGSLPCKKLGSDHLALISEFAFARSPEEEDIEDIDNRIMPTVTMGK